MLVRYPDVPVPQQYGNAFRRHALKQQFNGEGVAKPVSMASDYFGLVEYPFESHVSDAHGNSKLSGACPEGIFDEANSRGRKSPRIIPLGRMQLVSTGHVQLVQRFNDGSGHWLANPQTFWYYAAIGFWLAAIGVVMFLFPGLQAVVAAFAVIGLVIAFILGAFCVQEATMLTAREGPLFATCAVLLALNVLALI